MANNIAVTEGSGKTVATEDIGSVQFQKIKLVDGTSGSSIAAVVTASGALQVTNVGSAGSVSGTVGASIIGTVPITQSGTMISSISGAVSVAGTVGASIIGLPPFVLGGSTNTSVISYVQNSVAAVIIGGSIAASFTPPANQSVSGTVGASIIGTVPMTQSGTYISSISGQVTVVSSISGGIFPISGSVAAFVTNTTVPISGSVAAFQAGTHIASISGQVTVVSSLAGGIFPISGSVAATITGTANVSGSVASFIPLYSASTQGITSVMTGNSSVLVLAAPGGTSRNYITHVLVTNGGPNATTVTIQDGASILWGGYAAVGGGWSENFNPPLPQPTSVKALYATSSIQSSVIVAVNGFTGV